MWGKPNGRDKALALMVYETWLLNGATQESLPSLKLRTWCNRQVKRPLFPVEGEKASGGAIGRERLLLSEWWRLATRF